MNNTNLCSLCGKEKKIEAIPKQKPNTLRFKRAAMWYQCTECYSQLDDKVLKEASEAVAKAMNGEPLWIPIKENKDA